MSTNLPKARIKTIMKSSSEVEAISQESVMLVTAATEYFIKLLAKESAKVSGGRDLKYQDVSDAVKKTSKFEFLTEIIPKKITVKQFKEILSKKRKRASDNDSASSSGSDSDDGSSSSDTSTDDQSSSESSSSPNNLRF